MGNQDAQCMVNALPHSDLATPSFGMGGGEFKTPKSPNLPVRSFSFSKTLSSSGAKGGVLVAGSLDGTIGGIGGGGEALKSVTALLYTPLVHHILRS